MEISTFVIFIIYIGVDKFYTIGISTVCWGIWATHNEVNFDGHVVLFIIEIIFTVCAFVLFSAGLLREGDNVALQGGVCLLLR